MPYTFSACMDDACTTTVDDAPDLDMLGDFGQPTTTAGPRTRVVGAAGAILALPRSTGVDTTSGRLVLMTNARVRAMTAYTGHLVPRAVGRPLVQLDRSLHVRLEADAAGRPTGRVIGSPALPLAAGRDMSLPAGTAVMDLSERAAVTVAPTRTSA